MTLRYRPYYIDNSSKTQGHITPEFFFALCDALSLPSNVTFDTFKVNGKVATKVKQIHL